MSKTETVVKGDVLIYIRGGKTIQIPFYAKSIIPNIVILENEFNFGNITTLGNAGGQKMALVNNSPIACELVLDLRDEEENPEV